MVMRIIMMKRKSQIKEGLARSAMPCMPCRITPCHTMRFMTRQSTSSSLMKPSIGSCTKARTTCSAKTMRRRLLKIYCQCRTCAISLKSYTMTTTLLTRGTEECRGDSRCGRSSLTLTTSTRWSRSLSTTSTSTTLSMLFLRDTLMKVVPISRISSGTRTEPIPKAVAWSSAA